MDSKLCGVLQHDIIVCELVQVRPISSHYGLKKNSPGPLFTGPRSIIPRIPLLLICGNVSQDVTHVTKFSYLEANIVSNPLLHGARISHIVSPLLRESDGRVYSTTKQQ